MTSLVISVPNAGEVQRKLQALQLRMRNLRPVLDEIGGEVETITRLRFMRGIGPDGRPWTVSKRAAEENGQTLVDSARLSQSINRRATSAEVRVGTNVIYAAIHQFGGDITRHAQSRQVFFKVDRWGHHGSGFVKRSKANVAKWATVGEHKATMPARPYLGISPADERTIHRVIDRYIRQAVGL